MNNTTTQNMRYLDAIETALYAYQQSYAEAATSPRTDPNTERLLNAVRRQLLDLAQQAVDPPTMARTYKSTRHAAVAGLLITAP